MMKKRNDEGFALAYVVVVIFILCSIAIALMSSTLRTLQAQENMVQRMKDKYEAMGEIERQIAEFEAEWSKTVNSTDGYTSDTGLKDEALSFFSEFLVNLNLISNENDVDYSEDPDDNSWEYVYICPIEFEESRNDVTINAVVDISIGINEDVTEEIPDQLEPIPEITETYIIQVFDISFSSYEITSNGGGS